MEDFIQIGAHERLLSMIDQLVDAALQVRPGVLYYTEKNCEQVTFSD